MKITWSFIAILFLMPLSSAGSGMEPYFEENLGQIDNPDVLYVASGREIEIGFAKGKVLFNAPRWVKKETGITQSAGGTLFAVIVGDGDSTPVAHAPRTGVGHYLLGTQSERWKTNVRHYGRVYYRDVYPGIDLHYFFDEQDEFKYEFLVKPGADPSRIELVFTAVDGVELRNDLTATISTTAGRLQDGPLVSYQIVNGEARTVKSVFRRTGPASYRVDLAGHYDPRLPLVIDPTLQFASYWGVGGANNRTAAIDKAGNVYVAGGAYSPRWPTTLGAYDRSHTDDGWPDVAVAKFAPDGALVWSTLIGGKGEDYAYVAAINDVGELYVAGRAGEGFPTTLGAFDRTFNGGRRIGQIHDATDAFVLKLSADGSKLLYSTFIGSSANDLARAIELLPTGELLVGGTAWDVHWFQKGLPTTRGAYKHKPGGISDGWVAKVSADGSKLIFCTYFGTGNDTKEEYLRSLGVDPKGNVWIAGTTDGNDLRATPNAFQAFHGGGETESYVGKLSPDGQQLVYFSWLGGRGHEYVETEGVSDAQGNFFIAGGTSSPDFPFTLGAFQSTIKGGRDGFIAKINNDGSLGFVTAFGGSSPDPDELFWGPAVDARGNVYATGRFPSKDCPVTSNALQPHNAGNKDAFLAVFSPDGARLLYGTYVGGSGNDTGRFIAISPDNSTVVLALETSSTDLPLINANNTVPSGAYVAKFDIRDISMARE
jgi:hypothetical protein